MKIPILIALLSACASHGTGGPRSATLEVENNNWLDAVVYFLPSAGSTPQRLGRVGGLSDRKLRLPGAYGGMDWRIGVRLFASEKSWLSANPFWASGQDCLRLVVGSMLSLSEVRPC